MEKKIKILSVVSIITLIIVVGLFVIFTTENYTQLADGTKVFGDFNKVEIIDYRVITQEYKDDQYQKIGSGFIKIANASRYLINITVRNIDSMYYVTIVARFYDSNNNLLCQKYGHVERTDAAPIYQNQILYFEIVYPKEDLECKDHFDDVDYISFFIYADRPL